jgi:hypothetical protein
MDDKTLDPKTSILCSAIAQQIDPATWQLWGTDIHWLDPTFDTPSNNAIVAGIIADYPALEAAYLTQQAADKDAAAALKAKEDKAKVDLKTVVDGGDPVKWSIDDVVTHLKYIETILGLR